MHGIHHLEVDQFGGLPEVARVDTRHRVGGDDMVASFQYAARERRREPPRGGDLAMIERVQGRRGPPLLEQPYGRVGGAGALQLTVDREAVADGFDNLRQGWNRLPSHAKRAKLLESH